MVEKFKFVLNRIVEQKGPVTLFAILKMDEYTDKWSVILSATWITEVSFAADFNFVRDVLIEAFTSEEMATIARLGIFPHSEHLVQELLKYKKDSVISSQEKINGNIVHEAHILASNSELLNTSQLRLDQM